MTPIIDSLAQVSDRYDAVFCDLWGCLHNGVAAFPAAVAALQAYRQRGGTVVLLTNAPRPNVFVEQQVAKLGVPRDAWDVIVTSGDCAQEAMLNGAIGPQVHHIGPRKDDGFFTELPDTAPRDTITRVPLSQATGIVVTGPLNDATDTPESYRDTLQAAHGLGLPLICANPDLVVDMGHRRLLCAGAIAALYEEIGGTSLYYGKPHSPVYVRARAAIGAKGEDAARILGIGDGFGTDIAGGVAEGIDTLFVTGGIETARFGPDPDAPDPARLAEWLAGQAIAPTWAIGKLR
jgi:HAD superfamily hydrolase (TIGR01459 family)